MLWKFLHCSTKEYTTALAWKYLCTVYINCILQKPRRDLRNLSVISGCRIGPNLITASALDSMLSSPKVKVKVKVKVTAY